VWQTFVVLGVVYFVAMMAGRLWLPGSPRGLEAGRLDPEAGGKARW
jgi:hypothetical protein